MAWEVKEFEECLDKVAYPTKIQRKDFLESGDFPIVSQEQDLINGYWNNSEDLVKVTKPIIIFGDHTQVLKFIEFDFVLGADGVKILKPIAKIESKFFFYCLQSVNLRSLGYARHYRLLKELKIPIPPLAEQKRIVAILDEAFSAISTAKENAEKNLKNSKELFESYLNNIFEKKGKDWKEKKLGEVCDVRDGTHDSPKYHKEGYAFVTSKNLKIDTIDLINVNLISEQDYTKINERSKVDKGDILFAMIGTIGNPVVVEMIPNFAIKNVALIKVPKLQSNYFLKYYLGSRFVIDKMAQDSKGSTQQFVGLGYLRNFKINLPPLKEQQRIVAKLDALSEQTKKLEAVYSKKLADLDELKKSILQKAFRGEL